MENKICPICELNYILEEQDVCDSCKKNMRPKQHTTTNKKNINYHGNIEKKLKAIGSSWFVSYLYSQKIDKNHENYKIVSTWPNRKTTCDNNKDLHKEWLEIILKQSEQQLGTNTIDLLGEEVLEMAKKLLEKF